MTAAVAVRRPAVSRASAAVAALAVAVAGLAVATAVLLLQLRASEAAQAARTASVVAARQEVPALLSYSYQTFRAGVQQAAAGTTGTFRATYLNLMSRKVGPAALARHVTARAAVTGASVISAGPSQTRLLLFLSEQTSTAAKQEPVLNDTAVRVTMREVAGRWLVAGLLPRS